MALQGTDLLVVQHAGVVYKLEADALASFALSKLQASDLPIASSTELGAIKVGANLTIDGAGVLDAVIPTGINFKGPIGAADDAPGTPTGGDLYIFDSGGALNATWGGLTGTNVSPNDGVVYDADHSEWDYLPGMFGVGVTSISGADPIEVDSSNSSSPIVKIKPAVAGSNAGSISALDQEKLDGISAGAQVGTVTKVTSATGALSIADESNEPDLSIRTATVTQDGITQLAAQADVDTASTSKVIPAQLFKGHEDRIDALEAFAGAGSVTEVTAQSPLNVANGTTTPDLTIDSATKAQTGVVQLADATDLTAGASDKAVTADQLKTANDRLDSLEGADDINVIGDANAIEVASASAGGVTTYTVSAKTATDAQEGVVQLATTTEVENGADATKAATSYGIAQRYLINNFSELSVLP